MKRTFLRSGFVAFLVLALLGTTACASINGLDMKKAIQSSLTVDSMEGKAHLNLELIFDEQEELEPLLTTLLSHVEIQLNEIKQQDSSTVSSHGKIVLGEYSIPFAIYINSTEMLIKVEGISTPLQIGNGLDTLGLPVDVNGMMKQLQPKLIRSLVDYIVPHFPKPKNLSAERTSITIHDEPISVVHLNTKIHGDEFLGLIKQLLQGLIQDEEGLRAFLSEMYDLLMPMFMELIQSEMMDDEFGPPHEIFQLLQAYLNNKVLVVEFLMETIIFGYQYIVHEWDNFVADTADMNASSYLELDLYFDGAAQLRKSEFELVWHPSESIDGLAGLKLSGSQESWNINGEVTSTPIEAPEVLNIEYFIGDELLRYIESGSVLAEILTSMGLHEEKIQITPTVAQSNLDYYEEYAFIWDQTTYVNAYWLAYQLDLLIFDRGQGIVELKHAYTGQTLTFDFENDLVKLDGELVESSTLALDQEGQLFVPLRFVAETFGAEVEWDSDNKLVILTKRYF